MTLIQKIRKSKYHLIISVLPFVIISGGLKIIFHIVGWEVIPKELSTFFPGILTGIIFILGFLLAGVVTDYKESEKIPNDIATSLLVIWQEADYLRHVEHCPSVDGLIHRLKLFIPTLKKEFFLKQNDHLSKLLDEMSHDIIMLGKEGATPNYLLRIKSEIANLNRIINRIKVIKTTDFIPSVYVCIQTITVIFLLVYSLLVVEPWWGGLILVCIFTFVIFSLLKLIKDIEDPFQYDGSGHSKADEVSLAILDDLEQEFVRKSPEAISSGFSRN